MADNYLERKMEEYRQGAPRRQQRKSPSGNRPGTLVLPFKPRRVAVTGCGPTAEAAVRAFAAAGCRTAFCCADRAYGTGLAQSSGSCFFPVDDNPAESATAFTDRVAQRFGGIDILIDTSADTGTIAHVAGPAREDAAPILVICITDNHDISRLEQIAAETPADMRIIHIVARGDIRPTLHADIAALCLMLATDAARAIIPTVIPVG